MWPHMWGGGDGWWIVMVFGMLLFLVLVGVGVYLLYRALAHQGAFAAPPAPGTTAETPRAVLDRRLAAGEISPEEYDALRRRLDGG